MYFYLILSSRLAFRYMFVWNCFFLNLCVYLYRVSYSTSDLPKYMLKTETVLTIQCDIVWNLVLWDPSSVTSFQSTRRRETWPSQRNSLTTCLQQLWISSLRCGKVLLFHFNIIISEILLWFRDCVSRISISILSIMDLLFILKMSIH